MRWPLALMLLAAAGCSTSTLNGGLGEVCLEFTPLASCSTAQVVARQGAASTCAEVKVELVLPVAGGVTDVFGATFTLGYDPAETFFSSASEAGSLLGADGAPVIVNPPFSTTQPVSVVITRSGVTTGADPLATNELLITLSFVRLATSGSAELTLEDGELWSYGQPPVPKPGIAFCGGTLSIN